MAAERQEVASHPPDASLATRPSPCQVSSPASRIREAENHSSQAQRNKSVGAISELASSGGDRLIVRQTPGAQDRGAEVLCLTVESATDCVANRLTADGPLLEIGDASVAEDRGRPARIASKRPRHPVKGPGWS